MTKLVIFLLLLFSIGINCSILNDETNSSKTKKSINILEEIFTPQTYYWDILVCIIIFLISILTTITGIGGGALLVPMFMLINNFSTNTAVPLSVSTILGSTVVRIVFFYKRDHPKVSGRNLIYYFPILIIVPFISNTNFVGTILADLLPNLVTIIMILLLLGYTFVKTLINGINKLRMEKRENKLSKIDQESSSKLNLSKMSYIEFDGLNFSLTKIKLEDRKVHNNAKDNMKKNIIIMVILLTISLLASAFTLARTPFSTCGWQFGVLVATQELVIVGIGIGLCFYIRKEIKTWQDNNYLTTDSDIIFSLKNIIKIIIFSSITGMLATYIGLGGGSIIAPLLIDLGISPDVMVATSAAATLFSSLISTLTYIIQSKLLLIYAAVYLIFSISGSIVGILILKKIGKKYQSYIIFLLCLTFVVSTILLILNITIGSNSNIFTDITFGDIC